MSIAKRVTSAVVAAGALVAVGLVGTPSAASAAPVPQQLSALTLPASVGGPANSIPMYRIFSTQTSEHFYTSSMNEVLVNVKSGVWNYEGIGWYAPTSGVPVYRLAAVPGTGSAGHLFTTSEYEKNVNLATGQWVCETAPTYPNCVGWYSGGSVQVVRAYEPKSGQHNYTTDMNEQTVITTQWGWQAEVGGWQGVSGAVLAPVLNNDRLAQLAIAYINTLRAANLPFLTADPDLTAWAQQLATDEASIAPSKITNECHGAPAWALYPGDPTDCWSNLENSPNYNGASYYGPFDGMYATPPTYKDVWDMIDGMATPGGQYASNVLISPLANRMGIACAIVGVYRSCIITIAYK